MPRSGPLAVDPIAEAKRQWTAHGWTDAAAGMSVVTSIIRAQQLLMARIDGALKPFALSFARYEMLRLLGFTRQGRMPMASAIARLQVHPTSVTNTVDRLVRDGFVVREPHPVDGRAAMLVLTPEGRALVERATDALNTEVFADPALADHDMVELVRILARFRKDAGDFTDPRPIPDPL
jgi:DNA-binding MarR family transcriptional regulator